MPEQRNPLAYTLVCPVCGAYGVVHYYTITGVSFRTRYFRCPECGSTWKIRRIKNEYIPPPGEARIKMIITHRAQRG